MRSRKSIESDSNFNRHNEMRDDKLILEVLLDIRDIMTYNQTKPKVVFP